MPYYLKSLVNGLDDVLVAIPDHRHDRGEDLTDVGDHGQREGHSDHREHDAENATGRRHRRDVAVA